MGTLQNNSDRNFSILRKNVLFEAATNQSITYLAAQCKLKHFVRGVNRIDKEKNLYKFYIINKGKIKVFNLNSADKHFTLFILSENDVFDVFPLINNHQHNVCYEILENLELLAISMDVMRDWLKHDSLTLNSFFKYTIEKFLLLESNILDLGTNNLTARLANLLVQYYNVQTNQIECIDSLTHDELAQLIGTSRAVFNRHIQKFKKLGIIKVSRKHIEILNLHLLKELSQPEDPFI